MIYWRYQQSPDPATWAPLAVLAAMGVVAYRFLFTLLFGKSIGMALAGVRPVEADGRPVGFFGSLMHAAFFILGRVVSEADWKRAAARAAYFSERKAKAAVTVETAKPGLLGLSAKKIITEPEGMPTSGGDVWNDPDWIPPKQQASGDPWTDPNWKPPPDSGNDPWNDPSR